MSDDYDDDEQEADRRKEQVGMAPTGSDEYYENAYYILKAYTNPNEETRRKIEWLEANGYGSSDEDD